MSVQGDFPEEEVSAYARMINNLLADKLALTDTRFPINPEGNDLFYKLQDGMIGIHLINELEKDRIDMRTVNKILRS